MKNKKVGKISRKTSGKTNKREWNLGLLYKSPKDPQIEKDVAAFEKLCNDFAANYNTPEKKYLSDEKILNEALTQFEKINGSDAIKSILYFYYLRDIEASNPIAAAQMSLLMSRFAKIENSMAFFKVSLGTISHDQQKIFLASKQLAHFKVFLERIFSDARHMLSLAEEKIINLKFQPAYEMWLAGNDKILASKMVTFRSKKMPFSEANDRIASLKNPKERRALSDACTEALKTVAPFSEAEINAIVTNKKIDDELRGFSTAYESTVLGYRNDPKVVENLIKTVNDHAHISHRFYKLKAKLLKQKTLSYADRAAGIGSPKAKFDFETSAKLLKKTFGDLNPRFSQILGDYIENGQIDAFPREGKKGGAYQSSTHSSPTYVLLNHIGTLNSFSTLAHEMGHAFHSELSKSQTPLYSDYSFALAETASTLFESIALESVFEKLSDKEKIIVLHDKIQDDISTIFRQIACFNFENKIHTTIREKGFMPATEIAAAHNNAMQAYLGPLFKLMPDDGYFFVQWGHIRRFFYVYSYAYGQIVSKALVAKYRRNKAFWKDIEKFLSAGGKASPEEILAEIGIDLSSPDFFKDGLLDIERDILNLEKLTLNKKK